MTDLCNKHNPHGMAGKPVCWCSTCKSAALWRWLLGIVPVSNELRCVFQRRLRRVVDINLLMRSSNHRFTGFCQASWLFSKGQLDTTMMCLFPFPSLSICHVAYVDEVTVSFCSICSNLHESLYFSELNPYLEAKYRTTCVEGWLIS